MLVAFKTRGGRRSSVVRRFSMEVEMARRLYRSRTEKMLGGVCAGLGELLDIDPTIVRLVFVLLTIWGGAGAIIYLVLWLIAPYKDELKNP